MVLDARNAVFCCLGNSLLPKYCISIYTIFYAKLNIVFNGEAVVVNAKEQSRREIGKAVALRNVLVDDEGDIYVIDAEIKLI